MSIGPQAKPSIPVPPILSTDQRWAVAHVLHMNGLIDPPVPGRLPVMLQRHLGTFADGIMAFDRWEIETSVKRAGAVRHYVSVVEVSSRGAVRLIKT